MEMAGRKRPAWITSAVDQRRAEIRDDLLDDGITLADDEVATAVLAVVTCVEAAFHEGIIELMIELDAWREAAGDVAGP